MIQVKEFGDQIFKDQRELLNKLRDNKEAVIAQKRMATKLSDPLALAVKYEYGEGETELKSFHAYKEVASLEDISKISLDLAINTSNIFDSHLDLHLPKMWNKSLREQKNFYLLQEHLMKFQFIITDEVKARASYFDWKDLGAPYAGKTQALMFKSVVHKERNPFMFDQYAKGYVKNHSVGMRYIRYDLALNSDSEHDKQEKDTWDKYLEKGVNPEVVEPYGFFWAVHEAKIIEGSAVPVGSNTITPVVSMETKDAVDPDTSSGSGAGKEATPNATKIEYYRGMI